MKYLITGLGNPGKEYDDTRHNVGFAILDRMAKAFEVEFKPDTHGDMATVKHKGRTLLLLKPNTYMNLSGKAVRYHLQKQNIVQENLLVVLDDLALPFGKQRLRPSGSPGGHNGLKHIDLLLTNNNYARLRFGIGNEFKQGKQIDYVLGKWDEAEAETLPELIDYSIEVIKAFSTIGTQLTMNQYNKK